MPALMISNLLRVITALLVGSMLLDACSVRALRLVAAGAQTPSAELVVTLTGYGLGVDLESHAVHTLLAFKNVGSRPLTIAQRNIQLVDADHNTAVPISRMPRGKVAAVHGLQVVMLPLTIIVVVLTAPITIPVGVVSRMVSQDGDRARRVPEGWYWSEFILDPGSEAVVRLYFLDDRLRWDQLRAIRVIDTADVPVELPLTIAR